MVEVVVSKSGSCEPMMAKPKAIGLAVPRIREVPKRAITSLSFANALIRNC
jgi:hypothetical protein